MENKDSLLFELKLLSLQQRITIEKLNFYYNIALLLNKDVNRLRWHQNNLA